MKVTIGNLNAGKVQRGKEIINTPDRTWIDGEKVDEPKSKGKGGKSKKK